MKGKSHVDPPSSACARCLLFSGHRLTRRARMQTVSSSAFRAALCNFGQQGEEIATAPIGSMGQSASRTERVPRRRLAYVVLKEENQETGRLDIVDSLMFEHAYTFVRVCVRRTDSFKPEEPWRYGYVHRAKGAPVEWNGTFPLVVTWATNGKYGGLPLNEHGAPTEGVRLHFSEDSIFNEVHKIDEQLAYFRQTIAGSRWKRLGRKQPVQGRELFNTALEAALRHEFRAEQEWWDDFQNRLEVKHDLSNLKGNIFINVRGVYFKLLDRLHAIPSPAVRKLRLVSSAQLRFVNIWGSDFMFLIKHEFVDELPVDPDEEETHETQRTAEAPADRLRAVDLARGDGQVPAGLRRQLPGQLRRSPSWDRTSIRSTR